MMLVKMNLGIGGLLARISAVKISPDLTINPIKLLYLMTREKGDYFSLEENCFQLGI